MFQILPNKTENVTSPAASAELSLNVWYSGNLEIRQEKVDYIPGYGRNITLSCPVTGQIKNYWYKNGDKLPPGSG